MIDLLSTLNKIPVSQITYQEWINIGMALKTEGYDCFVWDNWSKNDIRYHIGECERKWGTFNGSKSPITGATIFQIAKEYGISLYEDNCILDWNDTIEFDGNDNNQNTEILKWNPVKEFKDYITTLFKEDDIIGYVTQEVWQNSDGKWLPSKGVYTKTVKEILNSLNKYPDDLGATIGDSKPDAGAWIRFNPLDGQGVKNENVTKFNFALIESDTMPINEQFEVYQKYQLPIAMLVHSGGKSLHAIVHIDAKDYNEYRERVEVLYNFLEKNGIVVDKQNRNPSRLSRMPGVIRNGNRQYIVAKNIGKKSWAEWIDFAEGISDELPDVETIDASIIATPPPLSQELIYGVLRCGHKMLISGSSKAGKSFLLMELCIAISEGKKWLGFQCKKGRVMYVNLEIDRNSCINRFADIYKALNFLPSKDSRLDIWNLRGKALPLDKLVPKLLRRMQNNFYDAVIIDPIYKVITGDENNASEMATFCNQFDKICTETGCAIIYCHHHSKGTQGAKRVIDRASGSGVFARDPDAQLDMIQLELTDDIKNKIRDGESTAWRMESSLREFKNFEPVNFWFEYPIHRVDDANLSKAYVEGSPLANLSKSSKRTTVSERKESLNSAYDVCAEKGYTRVLDMAEYLGLEEKTIRRYLSEFKDDFDLDRGIVTRKNKDTEKRT